MDFVRYANWSPDGKRILVHGDGGREETHHIQVRGTDPDNPTTLLETSGFIRHARWASPDEGNIVALTHSGGSGAHLWDVDGIELLHAQNENGFEHVGWTDDYSKLATASENLVQIWAANQPIADTNH